MTHTAKNPVLALEKTITLVDALKTLETAGVTELADQTGLGKSLIHSHLSTLEEHGYVVKQGEEYRLGLRFLEMGGYTRRQHDLYRFGRDELEELASDTGELVNMMTEENGLGIELYRCQGEQSIENNAPVGRRSYLHCTSLGKSILAQLPEERVDEIIDYYGLPRQSANTITDRDRLFEELTTIRERGYALDDEERTEGLRCIGAPVQNEDNEVIGAISVSAPISRMQGERLEEELPERVLSTVNMIELNMRYA